MYEQNSGAFFAFEGIDYSGKSTQVRLLRERATALFPGREFVFTREPGGTPNAELLRETIIHPKEPMSSVSQFFAFASARHDHAERLIIPALKAGKIVVTDRYAASTWVYQCSSCEHPVPDVVFWQHKELLGSAWPRLFLVFDLPSEDAVTRRVRRTGQEVTHFDAATVDEYFKRREAYKRWVREVSPNNSVLIDASLAEEEVFAQAVDAIRSVL